MFPPAALCAHANQSMFRVYLSQYDRCDLISVLCVRSSTLKFIKRETHTPAVLLVVTVSFLGALLGNMHTLALINIHASVLIACTVSMETQLRALRLKMYLGS